MKKAISVLLVAVLVFSTLFVGSFSVSADELCKNHVYTNACDVSCNICNATRNAYTHNYNDCFVDYEDNIDYFGEWKKIPTRTGIYDIASTTKLPDFTGHYVIITDKNGVEVKFNEKKGGWPLVKDNEYIVRLKCPVENVFSTNIDLVLRIKTTKIFPDVASSSWYNDASAYVLGAGIMSGHENGKLAPQENIQRQDFLVMLARFDDVNLDEYKDVSSSFPDVPNDPECYYKAAIMWGVEQGIVSGYQNGYFGVGDNATREQIITFFYRYAQKKGLDTSYSESTEAYVNNQYKDYKNVSQFANKAILWSIEKGIISGKTSQTLAPSDMTQRCEVAQILYNNYLGNILPRKEVCIHIYNGPTCTQQQECTLCGKSRGNSLGHKYVRGECVNVINGVLCGDYDPTYCPKLYFTGDMSEITKPSQQNKKIECDIGFEYRSKDQIVNGAAKIKIQGSSSTQYAKKNYTINFYKDSSYSSKQKIDVGWGKQSKYCLKANWIDKTHSRNIVTARLASQAQAKYNLLTNTPHNGTIDGFPVEIYINGEFHGLYTMNIPKDEWMFGMDKDNPNHIVICGENWNDPVLFKSVPTNLKDWTVEAGPEDDETLRKVQSLVDFVLNSSDEEFKANFDQYLNLDSTLNYYVMMMYGWMPDNRGKNMLLVTYDGNVWYPSLYDLDTTWGTHWKGDQLYNYKSGWLGSGDSLLWKRIEVLYKQEIAERYFELREEVLDTDHVMNEFRTFYECIPAEVLARETAKWNTEETPIPGYDFSQIQNYIDTVTPILDNKFSTWR